MTAVIAIRPDHGRPLRRLLGAWRRRSRWAARRVRGAARHRGRSDAGMTTAEYAVGTLGACALAGALYKVVTSEAITGALTDMLQRALHAT
ncbi:DUF4244 domain-containing protein [Kitasatospora sp. Ki12]|uniref:DUF4244 domain-containing protein n=1 Tax=Kitasatospora xanthocidica TaxID=83382 RepID=UPI001677D04B|nr:DUF4244 domain-containing protein [Kitasatospora xanthocidica]GHF27388.1 hypothetical protein GCM10018790_00830 [Kitasatospora xanthocidica]